MAKDHGPQIKSDERYKKLRHQGMSQEKAARIANTPRQVAATGGAPSPPYEQWSKADLYSKSLGIGLDGRSKMSNLQLIDALRQH